MDLASVVAIDGPSGSGKSSMTKSICDRLGILHVDTGSMFRALAYQANKMNVNLDKESEVKDFLNNLEISYAPSSNVLISINGEDLTEKIRQHNVSELASNVSKVQLIRDFLLNFQRNLVKDRVCVMEGRDIGTVVFPNSFCKIFLTASIEVRAKRRLKELEERGKSNIDYQTIVEDVRIRDEKDTTRKVAPLKMADDACLVDTSDMNRDQVINHITELIQEKAKLFNINL